MTTQHATSNTQRKAFDTQDINLDSVLTNPLRILSCLADLGAVISMCAVI